MKLSRRKLTVPNIITLVRALAIPWVFTLVWRDPAGNWWIAAAFALTDNVDGILARLEDKSHRLRSLGFRRSETGRRLDPIVDKLFIAAIIVGGLLHGAIPHWLGALWFAQKSVLMVIGFTAEARRKHLQVSAMGKYGEFVTNCGLIGLLAAQAVGGTLRGRLDYAAQFIALVGIGSAALATYGYAKSAGLFERPSISS